MEKLFKQLNIKPNNIQIYQKAFTHKSIANETHEDHYNMLEFLGDSILQFYSSYYIYKTFPKMQEGEATLLRSITVNTKALSNFTLSLNLIKYVKISRGSEAILKNPKIQADLFESLVAAIYLDQGKEKTEEFLATNLFMAIKNSYKNKDVSIKDAKTTFQEYVQHFSRNPAEYLISKNENNRYVAILKHDHQTFGMGEGKSKKEAELKAAQNALEKLSIKNKIEF